MTEPLNLSVEYLGTRLNGKVVESTLPKLAIRMASMMVRIITGMNNRMGMAEYVGDPNVIQQI